MDTVRCNKCWFHGVEEDLTVFETEFSTEDEKDLYKSFTELI